MSTVANHPIETVRETVDQNEIQQGLKVETKEMSHATFSSDGVENTTMMMVSCVPPSNVTVADSVADSSSSMASESANGGLDCRFHRSRLQSLSSADSLPSPWSPRTEATTAAVRFAKAPGTRISSPNLDAPRQTNTYVHSTKSIASPEGYCKVPANIYETPNADAEIEPPRKKVRTGTTVLHNSAPPLPIQVPAPTSTRITGPEDRGPPSMVGTPPPPLAASILLLAQPTDEHVISPLHAFVRQQIEVFTASPTEMAQPAPGRKIAIKQHQVGLRCIHCRDLPLKDRIKRAVCYPSSVGRVYHSVSDMKFDHFTTCKGLAPELRVKLQLLKDEHKKKGQGESKKSSGAAGKKTGEVLAAHGCSSSTAQYYHDTARTMGMVDHDGGVFMSHHVSSANHQSRRSIAAVPEQEALGKVESSSQVDAAETQNAMPAFHPLPASLKAMRSNRFNHDLETARDILFTQLHLATAHRIASVLQMHRQQHLPLELLLHQQAMICQQQNQAIFSAQTKSAEPVLPTPSAEGLSHQINHSDAQDLCDHTRIGTQPKSTSVATAVSSLSEPIKLLGKSAEEIPKHSIRRATKKVIRVIKKTTKRSKRYPPPITVPVRAADETQLLALPSDAQYLNPLHCFVRRHVELFAATPDDMAAPAPGRKTRILLGQVGIRCVHCARLPVRDRVKRAVCYPPTVGGIYHSVSNMKFDHFAKCQGFSDADRREFSALRSNCMRRGYSMDGAVSAGSKRVHSSSNSGICSSSTAQYYYDAASQMGLVDTDQQGIRFVASLSPPPATTSTSSPPSAAALCAVATDGIAALMMAATNTQFSTMMFVEDEECPSVRKPAVVQKVS